MRIAEIETFVVEAGWRRWQFVSVRTDAGITGNGEGSDGRDPWGVVWTVRDFEALLIGCDPRPVELRYWDLYGAARQSPGGIAGIELAPWDIEAKALGVPVHELFGGPLRERQLVYWSHCDTARAGHTALIGVPLSARWTRSSGWAKQSCAATSARSRRTSATPEIPA